MFNSPFFGIEKMAGFMDPEIEKELKASDAQDPFITVQIPETEIYDEPPPPGYSPEDPAVAKQKKSGWIKRLSHSKEKNNKTKGVRMRRSELTMYFLKDPKTNEYRKGVIEPPGGRKRWLQDRIDEFEGGMLDEGAYEGNLAKDYDGLRKKSVMSEVGSAMDFFGQPYQFYSGQGIIPNTKKSSK